MKFIIGKKLNMTQIWQDDEVMAVTRIKVEPCFVVQVKTKAKDGYEAVQIGCGEKKAKNLKKPQKGHFRGLGNFRYLREFKISEAEREKAGIKEGARIDLSAFAPGDKVKAAGISKGKGFQGVVRRHKFSGTKKTHGNKDQLRMPGSIGATEPSHVFKGIRMAGQMGNKQITVSNLKIAGVEEDKGIILIAGAVPGGRNGLILISGPGELKMAAPQKEEPAALIAEEAKKEEKTNKE